MNAPQVSPTLENTEQAKANDPLYCQYFVDLMAIKCEIQQRRKFYDILNRVYNQALACERRMTREWLKERLQAFMNVYRADFTLEELR